MDAFYFSNQSLYRSSFFSNIHVVSGNIFCRGGSGQIGGVIGMNYLADEFVLIRNLTANINITLPQGSFIVGGVIGQNIVMMQDCSAHVWISGAQNSVGGLIGRNYGNLTRCYSTGTIIVSNGSYASNFGGLVGYTTDTNIPPAVITHSYSSVSIYGGAMNIGGFMGSYSGNLGITISNCFANGSVTSYLNNGTATGGFIGNLRSGVITNSYSIGQVTGLQVGGLIGASYRGNDDTVSSYWDMDTSGVNTSKGGIGKTTNQMQQAITYEGWDFKNIWVMEEGKSFPWLRL